MYAILQGFKYNQSDALLCRAGILDGQHKEKIMAPITISRSAIRTAQVWPLLVLAAKNQKIFTYGDIKDLTGMATVGVGKHSLKLIKHYCERNEHPALTALVVNKRTGVPGVGLEVNNLSRTQMKVFKYDWVRLGAPSAEELAEYE